MIPARLIVISFSFAIAACSPAVVQQEAKVSSGQNVTCQKEARTGSNMPRRVCTTAAERAAKRDESQRTLDERAYRPSGAAGSQPASAL